LTFRQGGWGVSLGEKWFWVKPEGSGGVGCADSGGKDYMTGTTRSVDSAA
jgi:hypothetical protein